MPKVETVQLAESSAPVKPKIKGSDVWGEIRKHKGWYFIAFLLWGVPPVIATLWGPIVGSKTIPDWLAENGWPRLTTLVLGWLVVTMAIAFAIVIRSYLSARRRATEQALDPATRDFLIARLHELIKETDEFDQNEQGVLSHLHFRFGIGTKIEQFLSLYSVEWVTRFQKKKALALEEIIKELLGGAPIPVLPQPTLEPRPPFAELEKEYEIKPLEPNFIDHGNEDVTAHSDDKGVIVRGTSPIGDSFPVLVRSFGNEHRLKKVRSVSRVSFGVSFICFDAASQHTPKNNVNIHRGAWLTEAETEVDFPENCPPRRAIIATVEGANQRVYAVRRDSDSSYKTILPLREELIGSIYTVIISLRVESQKTASFQYILEIVRDPKVELRLNDARSWKSTHLFNFIEEGYNFSARIHEIWKEADEQLPWPRPQPRPLMPLNLLISQPSSPEETTDLSELQARRSAMECEQEQKIMESLKDWESRAADWLGRFVGLEARDKVIKSGPSFEVGLNRGRKSAIQLMGPPTRRGKEVPPSPPPLPYWTLSDAVGSRIDALKKIWEQAR